LPLDTRKSHQQNVASPPDIQPDPQSVLSVCHHCGHSSTKQPCKNAQYNTIFQATEVFLFQFEFSFCFGLLLPFGVAVAVAICRAAFTDSVGQKGLTCQFIITYSRLALWYLREKYHKK